MPGALNRICLASSLILAAARLGNAADIAPKLIGEIPITMETANNRVPKWSNGSLVMIRDSMTTRPAIYLELRDGSMLQPVLFSIPGATELGIMDYDRGADGTIGLAGAFVDNAGGVWAFVAWISPDGSPPTVLRTSPYRPVLVAVAPDGTLWTQGTETKSRSEIKVVPGKLVEASEIMKPAAHVLRHYERSGRLISSHIPQSTLELSGTKEFFTLRASALGVSWYSAAAERLVEISPQGELISDTKVSLPARSRRVTGYAVADDGRTYLSSESSDPSSLRVSVSVLNRLQHSWEPIMAWEPIMERVPSGKPGIGTNGSLFGPLYGVSGSSLVLAGSQKLMFYEVQ